MTPAFLLVSFLTIAGADGSVSSEDLDHHFREIRRVRNLCGPRAAWWCLRRTGRPVEWEDVLSRSRLDEDGMNLEEIQSLFASFGVPVRCLVGEASRLHSLPLPCLVVLGSRHCIVLERIDKNEGRATFFEPARGEVLTVPLAALESQCSGEVIALDDPGVWSAGYLGGIAGGALATVALWGTAVFLIRRRPTGVPSSPLAPVAPAAPPA